MEQHFVEEPCQEGWHRPVLSLFAKVFTVFSCKLPKATCFQKRVCRMAGRTGSHLQQRKTGSSRWGTPCCTYLCRMWIFQGASAGAHPIFVSSWLGIRQNAFTGSFSPWLHRGWFCAVPPSGRTIPPLQGRREQRRHWFWYPVRRSFPCPQRTA